VILRKSRKNYEQLKTHPCVDKVIFLFVGKYITKTQRGLRMFKITQGSTTVWRRKEMRTLPIHRKEAAHVNKNMHRQIGAAQNLARLASSQNSSSPSST
jgi:hypothetical protein